MIARRFQNSPESFYISRLSLLHQGWQESNRTGATRPQALRHAVGKQCVYTIVHEKCIYVTRGQSCRAHRAAETGKTFQSCLHPDFLFWFETDIMRYLWRGFVHRPAVGSQSNDRCACRRSGWQISTSFSRIVITAPNLPSSYPTSLPLLLFTSQHVYMETPKPGKIRLLLIYRGRIGDTALFGKRTSKCSKNNWDLMCKRWNGWKEFCWGWSWSEFPHFLTGSNSECAVQSSLDRKLASMKSSDMSWAGVWKLKLLHNIGAPFTCSVLLFSYSNIFPPWYWVL